MTDASPRASAKPKSSVPIDLDTVKDDLGIPATDTSNDAWLQRRIDGLWSRFQTYCARPLLLASGWADDWGELVDNHPAPVEPPLWRHRQSGTVFLRVFPVASITKLSLNGDDTIDPARLEFDAETGKLVGLDGMPSDLRTYLVSTRARIEYSAGFETLPADLYEALINALSTQWLTRSASQTGFGPGGFIPTRVSAIDVGEVDLSSAPNFFAEQATRRNPGTVDPLLGPFSVLLDPYVDWRSMIGGAYPTTVALPPPP